MLAEAAARRSLPVEPAIESNSFEFLRNVVLREDALTFQIAVGAPPPEGDADGLVSRPIDIRDVPPGASPSVSCAAGRSPSPRPNSRKGWCSGWKVPRRPRPADRQDRPPSTDRICPLIQEAWSLTRNSTAWAMSSGVPRRRTWMDSTSRFCPSGP